MQTILFDEIIKMKKLYRFYNKKKYIFMYNIFKYRNISQHSCPLAQIG